MQVRRRPIRTALAVLAAAVLSGCYTVSTNPAPTRTVTTYGGGMVSYQTPSSSIGIGIYTHPPQYPRRDGSIWYYGNHPHPANHALGRFCSHSGSHRHDYAPYHTHRYAYHDGHYFWVGDATPYASHHKVHVYQGHHPHPHYFGGYCRIRGIHQHGYPPSSGSYYRLKSGAYFFNGTYGADYYAERDRYDARGWRVGHPKIGYRDHERGSEAARTVDMPNEGAPARVQTGAEASRHVGRTTTTSPSGAATNAGSASDARLTGEELMERMRERTRSGSQSPPASTGDP